jgi:hypothetical protein
MFVTRGTTEAMGQGAFGAVTKAIAAHISGSIATPKLYPATEGNPVYFESVANGTTLLRNALTDYVENALTQRLHYLDTLMYIHLQSHVELIVKILIKYLRRLKPLQTHSAGCHQCGD